MAFPTVAVAGNPVPSTAERQFVGLLNQERANQGLKAVEISPALTDVADDYVAENVQQGGMSHDRDAPYTARAKKAGCGKWSGPVLAEAYAGPAETLQGWLDSPEHREVLLDPDNTHIGAAFNGSQALAFAMPCTPAKNTSGDFGDPAASDSAPFVPSGVPAVAPVASFRLASAQTSSDGKTIYVSVRIRSGKSTLRLSARSGRHTAQGRSVAVVKRARAYRLAVKVSGPGRWKLSLKSNGHVTRRFSVRVPQPR